MRSNMALEHFAIRRNRIGRNHVPLSQPVLIEKVRVFFDDRLYGSRCVAGAGKGASGASFEAFSASDVRTLRTLATPVSAPTKA